MRVSGRKSFITNGGAADFYCVLGREGEGYSMVLVPADTPGLTVERGDDLIAPHILGELHFDGAEVPENHRLGVPGKAFSLMLQTLAVFRVTVAGSAVGLAQAALDEALRHAKTRTQFGRPLLELGAVSQSLALSWTEVETARAITYRAAALAKNDPLAHLDYSSIAKVSATEAAGRVVDRAVQAMGRFADPRVQDRAPLPQCPPAPHLRGRHGGPARLPGPQARQAQQLDVPASRSGCGCALHNRIP